MTCNFETFNVRAELYRVWVPLRDEGTQPLVCVWIDPTMQTFESQLGRDNNERGAQIASETLEDEAEGPIEGTCELQAVRVETFEHRGKQAKSNQGS